MQRRNLLKRLPALPFAAGAAVSQGPSLFNWVGRVLTPAESELPPLTVAMNSEITLAQRIEWFTNSVNGYLLQYRPNVALPAEDAEWTVATQRAVILWTDYVSKVAIRAADDGLPLNLVAQIADIPEYLLRELMP